MESKQANGGGDAASLMKRSVAELKELCKAQSLKVTGTKPELVARLTGAPPPAKKVKASVPPAGVPPELLPELDVAALRKALKADVLCLARMVDADWHDGYEEQGEKVQEYVASLEAPMRAVLRVCCEQAGVSRGALELCNDVLVAIADSWNDMQGVPARGGVEEGDAELNLARCGAAIGEPEADDDEEEGEDDGGLSKLSRSEALTAAWAALLRCAAGAGGGAVCADDALLRFVKDAVDFRAVATAAALRDNGAALALPTSEPMRGWATAAATLARLDAAFADAPRLAALPTRVKQHKAYRAIDRRFDGPKNRRTRDFSNFDDECDY